MRHLIRRWEFVQRNIRARPKEVRSLTTVVPAECMLYERPDVFISLCTSAIWAETEAVGVPMGMRQKSAVHFGGVLILGSAMSQDLVLLERRAE